MIWFWPRKGGVGVGGEAGQPEQNVHLSMYIYIYICICMYIYIICMVLVETWKYRQDEVRCLFLRLKQQVSTSTNFVFAADSMLFCRFCNLVTLDMGSDVPTPRNSISDIYFVSVELRWVGRWFWTRVFLKCSKTTCRLMSTTCNGGEAHAVDIKQMKLIHKMISWNKFV